MPLDYGLDGHYLTRYCRYYPLDVSSSSISSWQQFAHIVTALVPRVLRTSAQCERGGESIRIDKIYPPRLKFAAVSSTL